MQSAGDPNDFEEPKPLRQLALRWAGSLIRWLTPQIVQVLLAVVAVASGFVAAWLAVGLWLSFVVLAVASGYSAHQLDAAVASQGGK